MPDNPQSDPLIVSTDALPVSERDDLVARLQAAWKHLPPETQAAARATLEEGHRALANYVANGTPARAPHPDDLRLKSYLTNDWDGHLATFAQSLKRACRDTAKGTHRPAM